MTTRACRSLLALIILTSLILFMSRILQAQAGAPQAKLSVHWEELTASDFRAGIERSQGTCLLPFGIIEKHGPTCPRD